MSDEETKDEETGAINFLGNMFQQQNPLPQHSNGVVDNNVYIFDFIEDDFRWHVNLPLLNYVTKWDKESEPEINIYIDSGGGELTLLYAMLSILSLAKRKGILINTYVIGRASSAASMIAIYGDNRYMFEGAYQGLHYGCHGYSDIQNHKGVETNAENIENNLNFVLKLYTKYTNLTKEEANEYLKEEITWLSSSKCKKYGLCDKIIHL